jgi:hypothetical protein
MLANLRVKMFGAMAGTGTQNFVALDLTIERLGELL